MTGKSQILFALIITGVMLVPGAAVIASGQSDGTRGDDSGGEAKVYADAGGNFNWNVVNGFVMEKQSGGKYNGTFNVTVAEGEKHDRATGHRFGTLHDIYWYDSPDNNGRPIPRITCSKEDLEAYGNPDGKGNYTVYVFEWYNDTSNPGQPVNRSGWVKVVIVKPNHPPVPVAWIVDCNENGDGNWSGWKNASVEQDLTYYVGSDSVSVKFYFNASKSWDPDGDNITDYRWDLDENSKFGEYAAERRMNTSANYGVGDHTIGLMVADGMKWSKVLDIHITIRTPEKYPDLTIIKITVENMEAGKSRLEKGDRAKVIAYVKNIGDNSTQHNFDVSFDYRFVDTDEDYQPLGTTTVTDVLTPNRIVGVEIPWDTGDQNIIPGNYTFRAFADANDEIKELREQNNEFESGEVELYKSSENGGTPVISIADINLSNTKAKVNDVVYINVTLQNTGDGDARYVDIHYYLDGVEQTYMTIDRLPAGGEKTVTFVFNGDTDGTFHLKFTVKDDGSVVATSDTYTIVVYKETPPQPPKPPVPKDNNTSSMGNYLPYIIIGTVIAAGAGGGAFFLMKKKEGNVWE